MTWLTWFYALEMWDLFFLIFFVWLSSCLSIDVFCQKFWILFFCNSWLSVTSICFPWSYVRQGNTTTNSRHHPFPIPLNPVDAIKPICPTGDGNKNMQAAVFGWNDQQDVTINKSPPPWQKFNRNRALPHISSFISDGPIVFATLWWYSLQNHQMLTLQVQVLCPVSPCIWSFHLAVTCIIPQFMIS